MERRNKGAAPLSAGLLLGLTAFAGAAANTDGIQVRVDGNPINFSGTAPTEMNGAVLVPLRGVFESLGAYVEYSAANKTIYANKGNRSITLPLNSTTATVNGQTKSLSQPAQVMNGSTLVPLRFVAESLGAYVQWVSASRTVEIQANGASSTVASSMPDQSYGTPAQTTTTTTTATTNTIPGHDQATEHVGTVSGTVIAVNTSTVPRTLTVRTANNVDRVVTIDNNTVINRSRAGYPSTASILRQIAPGDQVTVDVNRNGRARTVTASYDMIRGTIRAIDIAQSGQSVITLENGRTIRLSSNTNVYNERNESDLRSLRPGDHISIRTNPSDNLGYTVVIQNGTWAHVRDDQFPNWAK
jgi:hypothetical protein